ncbi:hypothetical protein AB0945_06495 [Streptomyces sp. NPDC005474]|uniref:hypothetical protein n=1 Tax=Streptomyces sp. NPDC005474 TaxID=3154878 RepID=UPI0034516346
MRTTAALISTAALLLTLAACSDGSGGSGSPADSATAAATATTAPPADAEAIRACMTDVSALYAEGWSPTTPPKTRPSGCESLSVTDYGYAYRSAVAKIAQDAENAYNDIIENGGLPSSGSS